MINITNLNHLKEKKLAQKRIEKLRKENESLFQQNLTPPEIVY
jgi:hypothetical protein